MARTNLSPPASPAAAGAPPRTTAARARTRIEDEHRELHDLLVSLAHTHDLAHLERKLAAFAAFLERHFATEEGEEGLHAIVGEGAGHRLPNLQRLFVEHRDFLARAERLHALASGLLEGPLGELRTGIAALAEDLRRHEADEDRLFAEAFYLDIGLKG
jgi:hypothetical protein